MIETLVPATIIKFDINFLAIFQIHFFFTISSQLLSDIDCYIDFTLFGIGIGRFDRNHWILFSSNCVSVAVCVGPTCCVSGEAGLVTERSAQSSQSSPHLLSHQHQPANLSKSFFKCLASPIEN